MSGIGRSFFDADKARGARSGPDVGESFEQKAPSSPLSVSALVSRIKGVLADAFPQNVQVVGELSNVKLHTSGHMYFRLKDANSAIDAVMFRPKASRVKFKPTDGLEVVVEGKVDVYDVRGQLQLYVERMTPKGTGALELAFRELVKKLRGEGLFDPKTKKPVPRFPRGIGVVTSPTGAAIRDIRRTIAQRWGGMAVYLVPVPVQGEQAPRQIARAIHLLDANASRYEIDTIIIARGGGSLEDLWGFNEEVVARAIFTASTPIICGVGHETDVTVADYVADLRAPTPTGAGELAVPDASEIRSQIVQLSHRLRNAVAEDLRSARSEMEGILRSVVFRDPTARVRTQTQWIDEISHRLRAAATETLSRYHQKLTPLGNRLAGLHPGRIHERKGAKLEKLTHQLRWVLGWRSKRAGDQLAVLERRLSEVHPRHRLRLGVQGVGAAERELEALSYRNVLRRGYSVTRTQDGQILRSVTTVTPGDRIETELTDGEVTSTVEKKRQTADDTE